MRLSTLVKSVHDAFEPDLAMADVTTVSEHDRYRGVGRRRRGRRLRR